MLAFGTIACYNINVILAHDPISQLDGCSILLKHPSRGRRHLILALHLVSFGRGKHPSRGRRHLIAHSLKSFTAASRNTPHGDVQHISSCALPIFAARHGRRLQKSERGANNSLLLPPQAAFRCCCPSRGHIFPLPSPWGRAFLCPKTNSPGLESRAVFGCAEKFFKKKRNLFNPTPPAVL